MSTGIYSKTHTIYCITNLVNYKMYFGYTSNSIEKRWSEHRSVASSKNPKSKKYFIHKAINKYGVDAFEIRVISAWQSKKDALDEERRLISLYESHNSENGYNKTLGGETSVWSNEMKMKASARQKIYYSNPENMKKSRDAGWGPKGPKSEETKAKISNALTGRKAKAKHPSKFKGQKRPKDVCEKVSASKMGHSVDKQTRLKISQTLKKYNEEKRRSLLLR